jgi:hypothetical protein
MDYIQIMKWLELIAYVAGLSALGLVLIEVSGWVIEWYNNWRERRAIRKHNHAHPKKGW